MSQVRSGHVLLGLGLALLCFLPMSPAQAPPAQPRLEAVAETRLLMEGLARANFRGLNQNLRQPPTDTEGWAFLRGQALLIAETGNLLVLRPPHNTGETAWQAHAVELRGTATRLARAAADKDYARCRTGLAELANVCNRCHQTFRVPVRLPLKDE